MLRIINPDILGKDVRIPDLLLHYRINSRMPENASLQGRDHTYIMPPLSVRVVGLVPADATDIRDTANEGFGIAESLAFRASVLEIVGITATVLGALVVLLVLVRVMMRTRKRKPIGERGIGDAEILRLVAGELSAVQRESEQGWDAGLVDRALAASRITAAAASGRPIGQSQKAGTKSGEGRLLAGSRRRRKPTTVSGGVTSAELVTALNRDTDGALGGHRHILEDLQVSLATLTAAQYRARRHARPHRARRRGQPRGRGNGAAAKRARLAKAAPAPLDEPIGGSRSLTPMSLSALRELVGGGLDEWRTLHLGDLQFWHRSDARLMLIGLVGLLLILAIARSAVTRKAGRDQIVLPALPKSIPRARGSFIVHTPLLVFIAGLFCFALAIGDPYSSLVSRNVTFPGRRIALLIDASSSMRAPFLAQHLNARSATDYTFFTTVGAAKRFVELRLKGKYRDLMALIEFGNEAYVVTPFTNDYDNILLSISLIGDPVEFSMFPDQGTIIAQAIQQSIALFKAFNFLDASGNLLVIFTDGEDTHAVVNGVSLDDIMADAVTAKVPVYFVRTNYSMTQGKVIPDELWIPAVAKTGGKFFAASDENSLFEAINEIDHVAAGTIEVRQVHEPGTALCAVHDDGAAVVGAGGGVEADRAIFSETSVGDRDEICCRWSDPRARAFRDRCRLMERSPSDARGRGRASAPRHAALRRRQQRGGEQHSQQPADPWQLAESTSRCTRRRFSTWLARYEVLTPLTGVTGNQPGIGFRTSSSSPRTPPSGRAIPNRAITKSPSNGSTA